MAKNKEPVNPFYVMLVLLGVVFVVTTCAYGTMTWRATQPAAVYEPRPSDSATAAAGAATGGDRHPLMVLLDKHGIELLGGELLLLTLATFGAMGLDSLRTRQANRRVEVKSADDDPNNNGAQPIAG